MPAVTDEQWAAARSIAEGQPGTHARLAACLGVHGTTLSHRAAQDGWTSIDWRHTRIRRKLAEVAELWRRIRSGEEFDPVDGEEEAARFGAVEPAAAPEPWPDEPPAERIARIGAVLTRHTEAILRRVEVGQPLEGRQVAALGNLVALCERIATLAREEMKKEEVDKEERMREALETINGRIVYLAKCHAREIAIEVFGIARDEVDAKLPQPVDPLRGRGGGKGRRKGARA